MDYLRLLQPPGGMLLKGLSEDSYKLFANALAFVFNGYRRARAKEMEAWDNDEAKVWTAEYKVCIAHGFTATRLRAVSSYAF